MHMHDHRLCSFMLHCSVHPLAYNMWGEWAHCALCELESQQPQQQPQQQLLSAFWLLSPMLAPPLSTPQTPHENKQTRLGDFCYCLPCMPPNRAQKALHRHHLKKKTNTSKITHTSGAAAPTLVCMQRRAVALPSILQDCLIMDPRAHGVQAHVRAGSAGHQHQLQHAATATDPAVQ